MNQSVTRRNFKEIGNYFQSSLLPELVELCLHAGKAKITSGNVKAGLVRIRHAYMPSVSFISHTPDDLITGGYKNLPEIMSQEAATAENMIETLLLTMIKQHEFIKENPSNDFVSRSLAEVLKNIDNIGVLDFKVWKWQEKGLLKKTDKNITRVLDETDEGRQVFFRGNGLQPLNLTKADSLTNALFTQIINKKEVHSKIYDALFEQSSGMFHAVKNNLNYKKSSIADVVIYLTNGKKIRVEVKAWYNMTFSFNNGKLEVTDYTRNSVVQGYRYLFESAFQQGDMTSLSYAIPSVTGKNGIKPDHVRDMLQGIFKADHSFLQDELLGGAGTPKLNFADNLKGKDLLAANAFKRAADKGDLSFVNIMRQWDEILDETPGEFPGCNKFANEANGNDVTKAFDTMQENLTAHLAEPGTTFGKGIMLVDAPIPE